MSQENVEMVREPLTVRASSPRRLIERLGLRFPRITAFLARAVWRLPLRSRLRRSLIRRSVVSGWEALNRRDLDVTFALYDPEVVSEFDPGLVSVGLANTHDREARIDLQREALATLELCFEAKELIHAGPNRLLTLGRMTGTGATSGAVFDTDWAALLTTIDGRVVQERIFLDRRQALEAVGLRE
jgi:ketosteroid isomerase-like protein